MTVFLRNGLIVRDRARPAAKGAAIVVALLPPGRVRICRWRGGQQHWSLPVTVGQDQLVPIDDWTEIPLTEAKRIAAAAYERQYLAHAMESAKGSVVDAARIARVDRSNFRRLLQRHGLAEVPQPTSRRRRTKAAKKPARKPARRRSR
jgi:hypothetical protein